MTAPDYNLETCLNIVLNLPGGIVHDYFVQPQGRNYGITQEEYNAYMVNKHQPTKNVNNITRQEVSELYKNKYWDPLNCGDYSFPLNLFIFDFAVISGVAKAERFVEEIKQHTENQKVSLEILALRFILFKQLGDVDQAQQDHLKIWFNRLDHLYKAAGI